MQVFYTRLTGPECMVMPMRATQGKKIICGDSPLPSFQTWMNMLDTCGGVPHSPIRAVIYRIFAFDVPSWVATHYSRHHIGVQPYIQSQRTDNKDTERDRGKEPQDAPVTMILDLNVNAILSIAKARLCKHAAPETRKLFKLFKEELNKSEDRYDQAIAIRMRPSCDWYGKCFEIRPCGKVNYV
jgi:hypothetical protein